MDNKNFIIKKTLRVAEKIQELGLPIIKTKSEYFEFPYDVKNYTDQQNNTVRKLANWAFNEGIEYYIR